jgi:hypothetical protein
MTNNGSEWSNTLVHLLALAAKLEGEGQYNNAKLARAAAEALASQMSGQKTEAVERLNRIAYGEPPLWRASLESPQDGERLGFASLLDLFAFLESETGLGFPGSESGTGQEGGRGGM